MLLARRSTGQNISGHDSRSLRNTQAEAGGQVKQLRTTGTIAALLGLSFSVMAATAWAEASPFVGRWHWDRAQSKLPPGEPVPADMVAEFTRVDSAHVRWSLIVTDRLGRKSVENFDTPANGEFYPVSSDVTAAFTLNGQTLRGIFKGPSGETDDMTCGLSPDHQKMTCNGQINQGEGKPESYTDVYDRG